MVRPPRRHARIRVGLDQDLGDQVFPDVHENGRLDQFDFLAFLNAHKENLPGGGLQLRRRVGREGLAAFELDDINGSPE